MIKFRVWFEESVLKKAHMVDWEELKEFKGLSRLFDDAPHSESFSLMQSTGLKDKNGVEIFEGDIVRHFEIITDISIVRFGEFGVPNFETEEYQDYAIGFYYENASEFKDIEPFNMTVPLNSEYAKDVVIVGNIYEQPELLGGQS